MRIGDVIRLPAVQVVYIYGLYDPLDGVIRYVGKTGNPNTRLESHYLDARRYQAKQRKGFAVHDWITSLIEAGRMPEMVILDITDSSNSVRVEHEWIDGMHTRNGELANRDSKYRIKTLGIVNSGLASNVLESTPELRRKIKEFRKRKRITQDDLAEMAGVSGSTISYWESGKRSIQKDVIELIDSINETDAKFNV